LKLAPERRRFNFPEGAFELTDDFFVFRYLNSMPPNLSQPIGSGYARDRNMPDGLQALAEVIDIH
jgi:hypothetical protein